MDVTGFGHGRSQLIEEYGSNQHNRLSVCTNAVWALGELAVTCNHSSSVRAEAMKAAYSSHLVEAVGRLVALLQSQKLDKLLA